MSHARLKLNVISRAVAHRNWQFARKLVATTVYGLTHGTCRKCGLWKGRSVEALCDECQWKNLKAMLDSIQEEEQEWGADAAD